MNLPFLKFVFPQVTGDLSASALDVFKSLGHFLNSGVMLLHNLHYEYVYIYVSNLVYKPRMLIFIFEVKFRTSLHAAFSNYICKFCPKSHSAQSNGVLPCM